MDASLIISLCGLLFTVLVAAVSYGVIKQKVDEGGKRNDDQDCVIKELATKLELAQLSVRLKEDRERNDKRIEELYNSRNEHAKIMATIGNQMQNLTDAIAGLKSDFKDGFAELKKDIQYIQRTPCKD